MVIGQAQSGMYDAFTRTEEVFLQQFFQCGDPSSRPPHAYIVLPVSPWCHHGGMKKGVASTLESEGTKKRS